MLSAVAVALLALILLLVTAPDPTILRVRVSDAVTGEPLYGALVHVQSRGAQPLPVATTDEDGEARFRNAPPASTYVVRVQQVDYELVIRPQVTVPEGKRTVLDVALTPRAGGRLYVGLDGTRLTEVDTSSLLPVATERLPNWKQGAVSHLRVHAGEEMLYTVTSAEIEPDASPRSPRPSVAHDEIDVLYRESKAIVGRLEVEGVVQDLQLSADGRRLLALTAPSGQPATLDQARLLYLDALSGHLLTSTLLADLDLASAGSYFLPLPEGLTPEARSVLSDALFPEAEAQMVLMPDGSSMYVLQSNEPRVWQLDGGASRVLDSITIQARPQGGALSADGRSLHVWAADRGFTLGFPFRTAALMVPGGECPPEYVEPGGTVSYTLLAPSVVITPGTVGIRTPLPGMPAINHVCVYFDPSGPYVAGRGYSLEQGEETDLLLTIRTSGNVTTSRQELPPGTTALAASPVRPELYVLNGPLGTLSILPLDGSAPTVIAVGNEPVAVAVSADGSWAYVANRQSQSISAIYLPAAAVIETIPLDGVPYSVALF
jgi:hypothetical protein